MTLGATLTFATIIGLAAMIFGFVAFASAVFVGVDYAAVLGVHR